MSKHVRMVFGYYGSAARGRLGSRGGARARIAGCGRRGMQRCRRWGDVLIQALRASMGYESRETSRKKCREIYPPCSRRCRFPVLSQGHSFREHYILPASPAVDSRAVALNASSSGIGKPIAPYAAFPKLRTRGGECYSGRIRSQVQHGIDRTEGAKPNQVRSDPTSS